MTSKCAGSRPSRAPKIVNGVTRPWYWGTADAEKQGISVQQITSWCKASGVPYIAGEPVRSAMFRMDYAEHLRQKLSCKGPQHTLSLFRWLLAKLGKK